MFAILKQNLRFESSQEMFLIFTISASIYILKNKMFIQLCLSLQSSRQSTRLPIRAYKMINYSGAQWSDEEWRGKTIFIFILILFAGSGSTVVKCLPDCSKVKGFGLAKKGFPLLNLVVVEHPTTDP